jgi:hypothetical protein
VSPPSLSRRRALALGAGAAGGLLLGRARAAGAVPGAFLIPEAAERGHRVRQPWAGGAGRPARADVLIVGGGVAGLAAAWRLRAAGRRPVVAELADQPGGTSAWGTGPLGGHALGAHYVTLPNPGNRPMRRLLHALGVIEGFEPAPGPDPLAGRPRYGARHLCLAPQERLWEGGRWAEGLWPETATRDDEAERDAFLAVVAGWRAFRGDDGRPAFTIPVALASRDPRARALAERSFADLLDALGLRSPVLRAWLEYGTKDDYGTTLADTSAWAGLHYHCARAPDPADDRDLGTEVLTWPEGNGWLVQGLLKLGAPELWSGQTARAVDAARRRVALEGPAGELTEVAAEAIVLAVPHAVRQRILGDPLTPGPDAAPWRVGVLHLDGPLAARGVQMAWDSVIAGNADLGYISSSHQRATYGGPTVLTWYEALTGPPAEARRALAARGLAEEQAHVLEALAPAHADLRARLRRLDVLHWGHGTVRPVVGLHRPGALDALWAPRDGVVAAHTDLSGLSLFEEALWHGVTAAESLLRPAERGEGWT